MSDMAIEDRYATLELKDGILHFVYKPIRCINLTIAKDVVETRLRFQEGISYPVLCDLRAVEGADKDARDYLAIKGSLLTKAQAFLIKSNYTLHILSMYLQTTAVNPPTEIFKEETPAIAFLSRFRKEI